MAKLKRKSRHSPAGRKWLAEQKAKTKPTYYKIKGLRRKTTITRLREAGLTKKELRALGHK